MGKKVSAAVDLFVMICKGYITISLFAQNHQISGSRHLGERPVLEMKMVNVKRLTKTITVTSHA